MTHTVIIVEDGAGSGGTAKTTVEWSPAHGISPTEEAKRREKAAKYAVKANRALYGTYAEGDPGGGDED